MDFPSIALLTDFGERDGFVGVMKGVIHTRLSQPVPIVDISHQIEPQNIRQALWVLESAYPYFPPKTTFVAIIDPEVGNPQQAPLLCYWPERQQTFIAPDNGLLTPIAEAADTRLQIYDMRRSSLFIDDALSLHGRSQTFYGRDVYAPLAALMTNAFLSHRVAPFLEGLGGPVDTVNCLSRQAPSHNDSDQGPVVQGEIAAIDGFGNLITNIPHTWIPQGSLLSVCIAESPPFLCPYVGHYSAEISGIETVSPILMVPSSGGTAELAVFQGDAQQLLQAHAGQQVSIQWVP